MGKKLVTPGDFIHARRRDLAITKGQAARMAGLTDGQWRDVEDGLRPPTDETLTAVARVLRVDPAILKRRYG
jgi:transcriptional regulator with XRE-family HTH domain